MDLGRLQCLVNGGKPVNGRRPVDGDQPVTGDESVNGYQPELGGRSWPARARPGYAPRRGQALPDGLRSITPSGKGAVPRARCSCEVSAPAATQRRKRGKAAPASHSMRGASSHGEVDAGRTSGSGRLPSSSGFGFRYCLCSDTACVPILPVVDLTGRQRRSLPGRQCHTQRTAMRRTIARASVLGVSLIMLAGAGYAAAQEGTVAHAASRPSVTPPPPRTPPRKRHHKPAPPHKPSRHHKPPFQAHGKSSTKAKGSSGGRTLPGHGHKAQHATAQKPKHPQPTKRMAGRVSSGRRGG